MTNQQLREYWEELGREKFKILRETNPIIDKDERNTYVYWFVQSMKSKYYGMWIPEEEDR